MQRLALVAEHSSNWVVTTTPEHVILVAEALGMTTVAEGH